METAADVRQRPVVLDTGELSLVVRRRGRLARAVLGAAVAAVLSAGAITAGGWSIVTAARGNAADEQPAPLWYPTPPPVQDVDGGRAPHIKPVIKATPAAHTISATRRSSSIVRRGGSSPTAGATRTNSARRSPGGGADDQAGDNHGGNSNSGSGNSGSGNNNSGNSGNSGSGSSGKSPEMEHERGDD
jgi:hypothetical protein